MTRARRGASGVICALAVCVATPVRAQINTAMDASTLSFVTCNGRTGFRTAEAQQAASDLNGDLDAFDLAFQVLNLGAGTIANPNIDASGSLACGGDLFAFGTSETNQGAADLNGDLDTVDVVLHVYDAATTTLTNVGLAVTTVAASPTLVAFAVPEADQGALGTDLNADGDTNDQVLHVYDPIGAVTTNVGIDASGEIKVVGTNVAFTVSEAAQGPFGTDLNGDGDAVDMVLYVYEAATSTLTNTGRQAEPGIQFEGDVIAFLVSEAKQNLALNPDTDKGDLVLTLYCLNAPPCVSVGLINLAVAAPAAVDADTGFTLSGDLVAVATPERSQNSVDLNGDFDKSDRVVQVYQISTGTLTNTGYAVRRTPRIAGNYVAFAVQESKQNRTDLNGDGDRGDTVVHIYGAASSTVTNTGRAVGIACRNADIPTVGDCFAMSGDMLMLQTDERRQGRTVLNADGDAKDLVVEFWRLSTGTLTTTGWATERASGIALGTSVAAFRVWERSQQIDLNGDFDKRDFVMAIFDSGTLTTTVLGVQGGPLFQFGGNTLVFRAEEGAEAADLNLDVDLNDSILHYQP